MDLRPVEAITAVTAISVKRHRDDVTPPFAIDGSVPLEDNPEDSNAGQQDWEPEEDSTDQTADEEPVPSDSSKEEPPKIVSLFA